MPKQKLADLNSKYINAELVDKETFAEERSNIMLVTGNHHVKNRPKYLSRLRDSKSISQQNKIRLTKNHIATITKTYVNEIVTGAPDVYCIPNNEKESKDIKSAEMHNSVWSYTKDRHNFKEKVYQFASDFVEIGEVAVKISWDGTKGKPITIEENRNEFTDKIESIVQLISGDLVFERIYGFDLLRDPAATSMEDSRWLIYRKMVDKCELRSKYADDPQKLSFIQEDGKETYVVFHGQSAKYDKDKKKIMVREFYFRPCAVYPKGYYYIATEHGILEEGELPNGLFPIVYTGFDRIPTSPRHQSIIKQLRPYQAEVNRSASKIAEHQTSVGDDKVFIQAGTKLSPSSSYSGLRGYQYTGQIPTILQGRSGAQYFEYMVSQVSEMYRVARVPESLQPASQTQQDPYSSLFNSMKDKKYYAMYHEKFERFLKDICKISLQLIKFHAPEQAIYPMIGRDEIINMQEFKNMEDFDYQIRLLARTDDYETIAGRQLSFNHILQYVGNRMEPEQIGQVIRLMPLANSKELTDDLTLDYDNAQNDILALDNGKWAEPQQNDNHKYMIKRLDHRMRKSDFQLLDPQIQEMYKQKRDMHIQIEQQQQQALQAASAGFIPSGGYAVGVDFYVNYDPKDPTKTRRARIPFEAVSWLIDRLNAQGMNQNAIAGMEASSKIAITGNGRVDAGQQPMPQLQ